MIALASTERLAAGLVSALDAPARPRWPLDETAARLKPTHLAGRKGGQGVSALTSVGIVGGGAWGRRWPRSPAAPAWGDAVGARGGGGRSDQRAAGQSAVSRRRGARPGDLGDPGPGGCGRR